MAGLQFTFLVPGDEKAQIARGFTAFAAGVKDLRPPFTEMADDFLVIEKGQFDTQGTRGDGAGWAPLTPAYAAWKSKNYPGQPLLVREGTLRSALTVDGPGHVRKIEPLELRVGADDDVAPAAKFHQSGTLGSFQSKRHGETGMPKRMPVELTGDDRRNWVRFIQRYLVDLADFKRAGTGKSRAAFRGGARKRDSRGRFI